MYSSSANLIAKFLIPEIENLAAQPQSTLTEIETFSYSDCGYTMTATAAVTISGSKYVAPLVTYTFLQPSLPLTVHFEYPAVTLATLKSGDVLTFVHFV
jgi:hypothetical protein